MERLAARDPGGLAILRGLRTAIVGPLVFAFSVGVLDNDAIALCAVFGACAALLFADFGGTHRSRSEAYFLLGVGGALLLGLGTWVSASPIPAVLLTFVVVATVRFLANLGPRWSAAMSPTILAFVLGALVPAPTTVISDRMVGWSMGIAVAAIAASLIRPNRTSVRIDAEAARMSDVLIAGLEVVRDPQSVLSRDEVAARIPTAREELRLVTLMPSRPAGAGADAMSRRQILDRLTRVSQLVEGALHAPPIVLSLDLDALAAWVIDTLAVAATVLRKQQEVEALVTQLRRRADARDATLMRTMESVRSASEPAAVLDAVDSGFSIRACSWHVDAVGRNAAFLAGAELSTDVESIVVPDSTRTGSRRRIERLFGVHSVPSSVWFRDAARAGIAVGASVALAFAFDVQHAFWVALGTLSVLRSSALATGRSAVSAAVGTAVGFGAAALAFAVIGVDQPVFWALLVVGFFGAGYLPQVSGIVAGQAAFTVAVIALFNIVDPSGWEIGLVRLENVGLGVSVSAVVALVFWPRRLEPLVARLTQELAVRAGAVLASTLLHPVDPTWQEHRDAVGVAEMRARAAMAEFLVQHRNEPTVVDPWITRFGVASHARSAADAVVAIRGLAPPEDHMDDGLGDPNLDRALHESAIELAAVLASGRGAPSPPCGPRLAASTRTAAEAAIELGCDRAERVTRSLLARDWLLATAGLVDARP